MTQEEKAKAYDYAVKEAYIAYKDEGKDLKATLERIFPELKESEDELTWLTKYIEEEAYCLSMDIRSEEDRIKLKKSLTWLKKQDHLKSADNSELKFKIKKDKWYVCIRDLLDDYGNNAFNKGDVYLSTKDGSLIPSNSNVPREVIFCTDTYFREWTIEDAKDGDVLATPNYIYIFNSIDKETETVAFYCLMKKSNECFSFGDCKIHDEILNSTIATKEQRNLFFIKIKESGYRWNSDRKELMNDEKAAVWFNNHFIVHGECGVKSNSFNTTEEILTDFKDYTK